MSRSHLPTLRLEDVSIQLGDDTLVPSTSLTVQGGSVTTFMGPSGAGKSSLLAYICGTLNGGLSACGAVFLNDAEISGLPPERRGVGILFQDDLLFPHMSVGENLLFAIPKGRNRKERRKKAESALTESGLPGFFDRDPATLSGGQRARVAVIRTLLAGPGALLLDEPFSKLDAETRCAFRKFVFEHVVTYRLPTLMVTHDPEDAAAAGGEVITIGEHLSDDNDLPS
jgi:putative thiamine transport system ATP-binding protein